MIFDISMNDLGVKQLREIYTHLYMTSFVKSAKVLEKNIRIKTVKYIAGEGYRDSVDVIEKLPSLSVATLISVVIPSINKVMILPTSAVP